MELKIFTLVDPQRSNKNAVPDKSGNYIMVLREGASLPTERIKVSPYCRTLKWEDKEYRVVYVGKSTSLKKRDFNQHFNGRAGGSTLRKSLGCLMGFKLIPRDSNPESTKTTLREEDEQKVSDWMSHNLLFFYCVNSKQDSLEEDLIKKFAPPLNLQKNNDPVNREYRKKLSELRKFENAER
jgi:hypothetical protein